MDKRSPIRSGTVCTMCSRKLHHLRRRHRLLQSNGGRRGSCAAHFGRTKEEKKGCRDAKKGENQMVCHGFPLFDLETLWFTIKVDPTCGGRSHFSLKQTCVKLRIMRTSFMRRIWPMTKVTRFFFFFPEV